MRFLYLRQSTDDAKNQKNSFGYQDRECRLFAERKNLPITNDSIEGLMENGVIKERHSAYKASDLCLSGGGLVEYQIERPKFMQMIPLLIEGKYDGVIVLCWDRISRNEQSDLIVKELINKHNIDVKFVQTDYDTKTSSGQLHMDIDGMFARHHSRVTSEKVRGTFVKLREAKRCTYVSNIGYLDQGSDNKVFDPDRATLVKRAFELAGTGEWTLAELTKWANKQGLTTKPRRRRRTRQEILNGVKIEEKTSKPISKSTMHLALTSQFYIGNIYHNDEWIPGGHPPLIDEQLFWRVQENLKARCVTIKYMDKPFFTYRGLVRCEECKRAFTPYLKKGHVYYSSKCKEGCSNSVKNVNENVIVEGIQKILSTIHFSEEELEQIEKEANKGIDLIAQKRNSEIEDLNCRKTRVHGDLDYLKKNKITLLREGAMSSSEWLGREKELLEELKEIDALHGAYTETEEEMLEYVLMFSELVKSASELYELATSQEKRRLAHLVFSELRMRDGEIASYSAKEEFEILLKRHSVQVGSPNKSLLEPFWMPVAI